MITFVATAYNETIDSYQFISSLILQTNPNWKCIVYCDAPNEYIKKSIDFFNDNRISYIHNETPKKWWGHHNRNFALNNIVDTEFIIQTSIQDYYTPNTVELILNYSKNHDFIYFNCIHNHRKYDVLDSQPVIAGIDWGSFAVRTNIAKEIGYLHIEDSLADGKFVERCFKHNGLRPIKINKILTVHN